MWIVLDPEPDVTVASDFAESEEALGWIAAQIASATDPDRITLLRRCVVSPYDPDRTT